ncbi:hypothetical protein CHK_0853 [Christensenella hongkongensis]|uniref:Uncharacterized protein n=1 Tax=Christensenella hongkongensis TaxID=270498 RepID=A0A0M2NL48_9FIRM|nr:hypothetical protein CHK_0853 [Christensenella hongkongensis]
MEGRRYLFVINRIGWQMIFLRFSFLLRLVWHKRKADFKMYLFYFISESG